MIKLLTILVLIVLFFSCRKKEDEAIPVNINRHGFFVVNEGNFTWANASLSFYDITSDKSYADIFYEANAVPLGDVAYSMTTYNNKGYIVVNNSGIVYVVNLNDMKFSGKITGLTSPRYMLIVNDSLAYVSDLYDTRISKINLYTNSVSGYINLGCSSENMYLKNGKVFVSSWSYRNMVYSFDALSGNILDSICVGKQPNSMIVDKSNNLWVLCDGCFSGSSYGEENPSLWCLNTSDLSVVKHFTFPVLSQSPIRLCANASLDTLSFINNGIYKMSIDDSSLPANPFITSGGKNFYGLSIDKCNGDVIVSDAKNFVANGEILIYSKTGQLKKTINAGVNPGWIEIIYN